MPEAIDVLLIDDEPDIRAVTRLVLERNDGWRVRTASSGSVGLQEARAQRPDVILLDLMMPDMDGREVLNLLRADTFTCDVPVILLTAKAGVDAGNVITKPFDPATLHDRISGIIRSGVAGADSANDRPDHSAYQALQDLWHQRRPVTLARIDLVESQLRQMSNMPCCTHRDDACRELHALAGLLGTFGLLSASRSASEIESMLSGEQALTALDGHYVARLLDGVRQAVLSKA